MIGHKLLYNLIKHSSAPVLYITRNIKSRYILGKMVAATPTKLKTMERDWYLNVNLHKFTPPPDVKPLWCMVRTLGSPPPRNLRCFGEKHGI